MDTRSRDLFATTTPSVVMLAPGACVLCGLAESVESELMNAIRSVAEISPFRHLITPGGYRMSVAMTNCGEFGWTSDRSGYRYTRVDPLTENCWPPLPDLFLRIANDAATQAGYPAFRPDACLINRYASDARLSLHRDRDEQDIAAPIVSISIGVSATFLWGGLDRKDRTRRIVLNSGDVVVWGGPARFVYHGIAGLSAHTHPLTGDERFNLTFRKT